MAKLFELKKLRAAALNKAEAISNAAEAAGRDLTETEATECDTAMAAVSALNPQIKKLEKNNTIFSMLTNGKLLAAPGNLRGARTPNAPVVLSEDYMNDFHTWIGTRGQQVGAALYEGSGPAGGYVVPTIVEDQVVPLAPTEMGVRSIATVIPTATDIKIPRGTAFGTAAAKAEGDGTGDNLFTESDPTLEQFTLSAFMAGGYRSISWELARTFPPSINLPSRTCCLHSDLRKQQVCERHRHRTAARLDRQHRSGNYRRVGRFGQLRRELLDATFDVLGTLNAVYHPGASWLMSRATGVVIRKAQMQANLFTPIWTRENGKDYLHGYPVVFDGNMPSIAASHTPVLFGDFKDGFVIGDRGGSGINVKILDQPKALEGLLVLLAYRRTDSRVRRSEAIQAITLHS